LQRYKKIKKGNLRNGQSGDNAANTKQAIPNGLSEAGEDEAKVPYKNSIIKSHREKGCDPTYLLPDLPQHSTRLF